MASTRPSRSSRLDSVARAARQKRWTPAVAEEVLDAQRHSGLSLAAFARRRGIAYPRLLRWRTRLSRTGPGAVRGPLFLPVSIRPDLSAGLTPAAPHVEIVLRGDRRVRVAAGCDLPTVARIVELLEGLPC